ncbi:ribosome maturation factor RimP [Mesorhizobium sp. Z1-4]|uniref:ribosome maturation factor RimP n=1 Tax=Mesorhizobium sp. Z1-4 TaxID=2448478 RepID=UPI000FDB1E96|nr:ribosome maturation factor RimP [Mesorhizobium sp. Z1-4]
MEPAHTDAPFEDDRFIRESGVDARVAAIVAPVLDTIGMRLVRVRLSSQNGLTLQIMAERPDGSMTIEDCEEASNAISPALDVEDPIDRAYNLEMSSPGIDRPLVRAADFEAALGHIAKIETSVMVGGRKRFRGKIVETGADSIVLERDQVAEGEEAAQTIPYEAMAEAKLILTDELVREALAKDRKLRDERKKQKRAGGKAGPE